jgi:Fe-S cluster assembly ATP-binding protein
MNKNNPLLEIKELKASINENTILNNLNLTVNKGEIHAIMGPNGSGKSTFSKVVAGHPAYSVLKGDILFKGLSILELSPEERSHLGIFLAFQYPIEIPGVSNEDFLRLAYNSKQQFYNKPEVDPIEFLEIISQKLEFVNMSPIFLNRNVNEGFSGGEKKKNEILQMILLDSELSILDETDSGLDIDALKTGTLQYATLSVNMRDCILSISPNLHAGFKDRKLNPLMVTTAFPESNATEGAMLTTYDSITIS